MDRTGCTFSIIALIAIFGFPVAVLAQDELPRTSAAELKAQIEHSTATLKKVVDAKTAKLHHGDLAKWRTAPFNSKDPEVPRWLSQLMTDNPELGESLNARAAEVDRLAETLDKESFFSVLESLDGVRPIDFPAHIERTAKILNEIKSEKDLTRLEKELRQAWKPIADELKQAANHGPERLTAFTEFLESHPQTKPFLEAQKAATLRLEQRNQALAKTVGRVMMGEALMARLEELKNEAERKAQLARARSPILDVVGAIQAFYDDYSCFPGEIKKEDGDLTVFTNNKEFISALSGTNRKENPRGQVYLKLKLDKGRLLDAWGKPYRVILDTTFDEKLKPPKEYGEDVLFGRLALCDSAGPDGKFETVEDNLTSWPREEDQ